MKIVEYWQNRNKVLGMNQRNLFYIRKYNKKNAKRIADDKILAKKRLVKAHIPTPQTIAVIQSRSDLREYNLANLPNSFVVKPVSGLEGGGIEIFYNRDVEGRWIRGDGSKVSEGELRQHLENILNGEYSLHQDPDRILIEERIKIHKAFKYYTYKGAPDIRVIVFNNIPIMSYIRVPTKESEGKANLALGALGLGIDIAKGVTTTGIHGKSGGIEFIPNTRLRVSGLKIPYWDKILEYAIKAQQATNLDFAAIDFLIDREQGPMIVELNARPGLSIQLANEDGLLWRLKKARGLKVTSVDKGIRLGKDLFGGEIESEIQSISGKTVIGIYENITLFGKDESQITTKAKIDTGADSTSIDKELAKKLGYGEIVELIDSNELPKELNGRSASEIEAELTEKYKKTYPDIEEIQYVKSSHGSSFRPYIKIEIKIRDTQFQAKASIYDRSKLTYPAIVGRKSLSKFLIDPAISL